MTTDIANATLPSYNDLVDYGCYVKGANGVEVWELDGVSYFVEFPTDEYGSTTVLVSKL
jgi:hypothetical protein